jgi:hypothetical protein
MMASLSLRRVVSTVSFQVRRYGGESSVISAEATNGATIAKTDTGKLLDLLETTLVSDTLNTGSLIVLRHLLQVIEACRL